MSCSNPFTCGIRKYDQHKQSSNTPSNQALHQENERQFEKLLELRKQQDQGIYSLSTHPSPLLSPTPTPTPIATPTTAPFVPVPGITYYSLSGSGKP